MSDQRRAALVLLVEDDPNARAMYAEFLGTCGFFVAEARNGLQALEKALGLRPNIIVTDLGLPGMDGIEFCRRLKEDERTKEIPVLAVTGYEKLGYVDRARDAGCDRVLTKPCLPDRLLEEINEMLGIDRAS